MILKKISYDITVCKNILNLCVLTLCTQSGWSMNVCELCKCKINYSHICYAVYMLQVPEINGLFSSLMYCCSLLTGTRQDIVIADFHAS